MSKTIISLNNILEHLKSKTLLDESGFENIVNHFKQKQTISKSPWYIKMFITFGAWMATVCFMAFLILSGMIPKDEVSLIIFGIMLLGLAVFLYKNSQHLFMTQLALTFSVTGHVMIFGGFGALTKSIGIIPIVAIALCVILYFIYKDSLHRFLSCLVVPASTTIWLINSKLHHGLHALLLLEIIVIGLILIHYWSKKELYPIAYSLSVSIPLTLLLFLAPHKINTIWWPSNITLTLAVLYLYYWVLNSKLEKLKTKSVILAIIGTIIIGVISTPGIIGSIGLLVLGYALYDKALLGLGFAFFPVFIVAYYYNLNMTLLTKSWILMGSGIIFLLVRWYLNQHIRVQEKNE